MRGIIVLACLAIVPAATAQDSPTKEFTEVKISKKGLLTMGGKTVTLMQLKSTLSKRKRDAADVLIRVHQECPFKHVVAVISICQRLDIEHAVAIDSESQK